MARAERLAAEYRDRAKRSRDSILRDAAERLRLREQREESIAKALGERTFRQQVQAKELKLQSHLDQVRWNLVSDVERRLRERMEAFMQDEAAYLATLEANLAQAAEQIESDELVAELNARDHQRLEDGWDAFVSGISRHKTIQLSAEPIDTLGGVRVISKDRRIRVDNTFEGRLERLRTRIQQAILDRLLPSGLETGNIFGG
jgi:V/A-type H+-transporting ATPase subunit E